MPSPHKDNVNNDEEVGIVLVGLAPKEDYQEDDDYDEEDEKVTSTASLLCPRIQKAWGKKPSGQEYKPFIVQHDSDEPKPSMKLFLVVAWVTFLGEMSRGLVVPVLWPYLQVLNGSVQFLGFVSSGFSFARFFAAPFFGWWSNKRSHKEVMLICLCFLIVGNLIFALYPPPWLLLISRVVVGIGAGTLGQSRGYVSQVTTKEQRTRYVAYLTVSQFAGFAVTPGISIILSYLDFDIFGVERLEADAYSSAGYLLAILALVSILIVFLVFVDPPRPPAQPTPPKEKKPFSVRAKEMKESFMALAVKPDFKKIVLFSGLIFVTRTAVAVVETASSEMSSSQFQWSSDTLSYFLCGLGILGTGILISIPSICKQIGTLGEGLLLSIGVFSLALGLLLMMPFQHSMMDKYTFVIGLGFTWCVGSALCQTLIISYLSRILNPDSQGAVMGWLASLGSVARIVGALWTGFALAGSGGAYLALGLPSAAMVVCLVGTLMLIVQTIRSSTHGKSKNLV